jgi:type VI secretion system protein ImpH
VIEQLQAKPYEFDFLQVVRRLECEFADKPRVGCSEHPAQEPVRFGQEPSMAFAPSTIASARSAGPDGPVRLQVHFLGLLGPNGPLPLHITEYVRDRLRNAHDPTAARFLDIFHHRMLSLFYRVWASHRQTVCRDRSEDDRFAAYVASLIGLGTPGLQHRDSVHDDAKLFFSGRLAAQGQNAEGLRAILGDYFGVEVEILQFVGKWASLPPEYHCRLGSSPAVASLGRTVVIGRRIWDCQQKFRIVLGPLSFDDFTRFLPTGRSYRALVDWVGNYVGQQLDFDVQPVLRAPEVPGTSLGSQGQLGWTTWLQSRPRKRDADDLILQTTAA